MVGKGHNLYCLSDHRTIRQKRRRYREAEGVGGEDPLEEVKVEAEVDLEEDEEEAEESELSSLGTGVSPADFNGSFGSEVADQSRADSEEEEDEWGREDGEEQQLVQVDKLTHQMLVIRKLQASS